MITPEVDPDVDDESEEEEEDDGEDAKKSPFISLRTEKSTSLNISVEVSGDENFDSMPNFITSPAAKSRVRK